MADVDDKPDNDVTDSGSVGPRCGERLLAARLERNISIAEIAKELHISEQKVEALECNNLEALGAQVFAKGYIRKYAQMVGAAADEIIADYDELAAADAQPVLKARPRPRREMSPGPWIAVIVLLIIAATVYWVISNRPELFSVSDQEPDAPASETAPSQDNTVAIELPNDAVGQSEATADVAAGIPAVAEEPVEAAETAVPQVQPDVASAADEGELTLLLAFSGDCWTEISDGSGRRLYFGQGREGRTVELSGVAPFNVLFGNASQVTLQVNGLPYDVGPVDRLGRARFTITGD